MPGLEISIITATFKTKAEEPQISRFFSKLLEAWLLSVRHSIAPRATEPLALFARPGRRIRSRRMRLPNRRAAAILPLVGVRSVANQAAPCQFPRRPAKPCPLRRGSFGAVQLRGFRQIQLCPFAARGSRNRPSH